MDGEQVMVVACIAIGVGGIIAVYSIHVTPRNNARAKRLELIEKAMEQPSIDGPTKQEMMRLLADDQQRTTEHNSERFARLRTLGRTFLVGAGWISFVAGGAMLLGRESGIIAWMHPEPAWTLLAMGFIAMTLPVATRELVARSASSTANE